MNFGGLGGFGLDAIRLAGGNVDIDNLFWKINSCIFQQSYTTAGSYTYTVPSSVTELLVVVIGGGASTTDINGGAAGACYAGFVKVEPDAKITITVGAANGGTSSFGSFITCTGGTGRTNSGTVVYNNEVCTPIWATNGGQGGTGTGSYGGGGGAIGGGNGGSATSTHAGGGGFKGNGFSSNGGGFLGNASSTLPGSAWGGFYFSSSTNTMLTPKNLIKAWLLGDFDNTTPGFFNGADISTSNIGIFLGGASAGGATTNAIFGCGASGSGNATFGGGAGGGTRTGGSGIVIVMSPNWR